MHRALVLHDKLHGHCFVPFQAQWHGRVPATQEGGETDLYEVTRVLLHVESLALDGKAISSKVTHLAPWALATCTSYLLHCGLMVQGERCCRAKCLKTSGTYRSICQHAPGSR